MEAKRRPTEIGEEAVRPPYCRRQGLVLTERSWMAWQLEADEEDCSMGLIVEHQGTEHRHCPRDEEKCTGRYTSTRIGGGGGGQLSWGKLEPSKNHRDPCRASRKSL